MNDSCRNLVGKVHTFHILYPFCYLFAEMLIKRHRTIFSTYLFINMVRILKKENSIKNVCVLVSLSLFSSI